MRKSKMILVLTGTVNTLIAIFYMIILVAPHGYIADAFFRLTKLENWSDIECIYKLFSLYVLTITCIWCAKNVMKHGSTKAKYIAVFFLAIIGLRIVLYWLVVRNFPVSGLLPLMS